MVRVVYIGACLLLVGIWAINSDCAPTATASEPTAGIAKMPPESQQATTGHIALTITYTGVVPRSRVPDETGHRHELLSVDRTTKALRYVLAYLDDEQLIAKSRIEAGAADVTRLDQKPVRQTVAIDQFEHQFVPRLVALRDGSRVEFTNSDLANHNVRGTSFVAENNFSVFVPYEQAYRHRFRADNKQRPVVLSCDIHPWMKAWIYVFDHSLFAVSDAKGKLRIDGISPGAYKLQIRQPDVAYRAACNVQVKAGETTRIELRISDRDLRP